MHLLKEEEEDYIGYKRLSENKRFPNHRWYSDATWGKMGEWQS
jgi:hypothetical protein